MAVMRTELLQACSEPDGPIEGFGEGSGEPCSLAQWDASGHRWATTTTTESILDDYSLDLLRGAAGTETGWEHHGAVVFLVGRDGLQGSQESNVLIGRAVLVSKGRIRSCTVTFALFTLNAYRRTLVALVDCRLELREDMCDVTRRCICGDIVSKV